MDDQHPAESTRVHHAPQRVVCVGDGFFSAESASTTLERLCRVEDPESPWKFWHLGDSSCTAAKLLAEAVWRVLGHDAGRLLASLGGPELLASDPDPRAIAASIKACMDVLADKGPPRTFLLLPSPSLWPSAKRPAVQALRQELSSTGSRWRTIDIEARAAAFVAAQAAHPDDATALVDQGPVLTPLGSLLVALEIRKSWD